SRRWPADRLAPLLALGGLAAGAGLLLARIAGDVRGKPLFEDEAVSGLIAARPLAEVVETVMWERGGGPLHTILSHATLAVDPSPYALRWLSVVFAVAALPLCWDVGRRLGGPTAGAVAALVAATSSFLLVYGSFARMYSLYVFAAALAIDLFLVAKERRTGRSAFAAAAAAWLLPAIHPYGAFLVAAEALVALWLWRGRPLRPALPALGVALAMVPFAVADLRLADRFAVGIEGEEAVAAPTDAWGQLGRALAATAGGEGIAAGIAIALVAAGLVLVARRDPAFAALCVIAFVLPPVLLALARSGSEPGLSPRHIVYVVPLAGSLIGVAVARAVHGRPPWVSVAAVAAAGVLLATAPFGGIRDPRDWQNDVLGGGPPETALGAEERLAAPAAWLNETVGAGDVLYPYSPVYWAGLPATGEANVLPYSQRELILRSAERIQPPVGRVVVSVPVGDARLDLEGLEEALGDGFSAHPFGGWMLVEGMGPYPDERVVLLAVSHALRSSRDAITGASNALSWYFNVTLAALCGSVRERWGDSCPLPPPAL
ncbi:MAG TPA: glycosyltransferase family 39 protein, partial [Gaiellaceae bacterium]|nr:glycosyltransferase family 39 protein [Gaiellaceae bacterium]